MTIETMSEQELRELIKARFEEARTSGRLGQFAAVARVFGHDPASRDKDGNRTGYSSTYGPKYLWQEAAYLNGKETESIISVYVDDYGHYMTIRVDEEKVCSTHDCESFIKPGDWQEVILEKWPAAARRIEEREIEYQKLRRSKLLAMV